MKEKNLEIIYNYYFQNPKFTRNRKVLTVEVVEENRGESGTTYELTYKLSAYNRKNTNWSREERKNKRSTRASSIYIVPEHGETAEEFFNRFHPIADLEYRRYREQELALMLNVASVKLNNKKIGVGNQILK